MNRAILIALGTAAVITSAAAHSIGNAYMPPSQGAALSEFEQARATWNARAAQRAQIEDRYIAMRSDCDALGGAKRDRCLVSAHAFKGRLLLETQAPYEEGKGRR
jgi:hypothetical protein